MHRITSPTPADKACPVTGSMSLPRATSMACALCRCIALAVALSLGINAVANDVKRIKASPSNGFNFDYYLYIPPNADSRKDLFLVVEPNNTGFAHNNLKKHANEARRAASSDFYIGRYVANALAYPLLIPAFPRSKTSWQVYTHALDRDAMLQKHTLIERLDLQLIAMVNDATKRLLQMGFSVNKKMLLAGFSASGSFANRFTAIHPNQVLAVAAGGVNGLLILPVRQIKGFELNYPIGINDMEGLLQVTFQAKAFASTPQLYFMGSEDANDAVPFSDAYSDDERSIIYDIIGKQMMPTRWDYCRQIYQNNGINAQIVTYPTVGHEIPKQIKDDIVRFFARQTSSHPQDKPIPLRPS